MDIIDLGGRFGFYLNLKKISIKIKSEDFSIIKFNDFLGLFFELIKIFNRITAVLKKEYVVFLSTIKLDTNEVYI